MTSVQQGQRLVNNATFHRKYRLRPIEAQSTKNLTKKLRIRRSVCHQEDSDQGLFESEDRETQNRSTKWNFSLPCNAEYRGYKTRLESTYDITTTEGRLFIQDNPITGLCAIGSLPITLEIEAQRDMPYHFRSSRSFFPFSDWMGKAVIDYGARTQDWSDGMAFSHCTASFTAMDHFNTPMFDQARRQSPRNLQLIPLSSMDGYIPVRDSTQDVIRGCKLDGRLNPNSFKTFIQEAWHKLRRGGILKVTEISRYVCDGGKAWLHVNDVFRSVPWTVTHPSFHYHLEDVGFDVESHSEWIPLDESARGKAFFCIMAEEANALMKHFKIPHEAPHIADYFHARRHNAKVKL